MEKTSWILCPVCNSKTRIKVLNETELKKFPLYCPKCKLTTIINVSQTKVDVIKEPDAKTQSQ